MKKEILRMENISKKIDDLIILNNVNFNVLENEIIALLGVNGAGKSMLMNILLGIFKKDSGNIYLNEKNIKINTPYDAKRMNIQYVYGEDKYIDELSVADNIFLGNETRFIINRSEQNERAKQLLNAVGLDINPGHLYKNLSPAMKKLIQIAAILDTNPKLIIMDEPTIGITEKEKDIIVDLLIGLKNRGISVILITNNIKDALSISDRISVIRDGISMGIYEADKCNEQLLVSLMTEDYVTEETISTQNYSEEILRVEGLNSEYLHDISFQLYKGEVLGLVGLLESGKSYLLDTLFGLKTKLAGNIYLNNKLVNIKKPLDAISLKIGYVKDDISKYGNIEGFSIRENITLPSIKRVSFRGIIINHMEKYLANYFVNRIFRRNLRLECEIENMSRGNRQKLEVCKWLSISPDILLLDMSTISIDIKSKDEIYQVIKELTGNGTSVIFTSNDFEDVFRLSDRIIFLREGRVSGEVRRSEAKASKIISMLL